MLQDSVALVVVVRPTRNLLHVIRSKTRTDAAEVNLGGQALLMMTFS